MKRLVSSALVVLAAFSVHAAYGLPARSTQILRAVRCCAAHCDHAKSPATAGHCCGVGDGGSELAVSSQSTLGKSGPTMHVAPVAVVALFGFDGSANGWARVLPATARGAPLFLLTHSLRI